MTRHFGLMLAAATAIVIPAMAAAQSDGIRGTIESVDRNSLTVQTLQGDKVKVALTDATKYVTVVQAHQRGLQWWQAEHVVAFEPAEHSAVTMGAHVFIKTSEDGGKATADQVAVGKDGLTPPPPM